MRVGIVGSFGSARQVIEMAVAAEEHGWDGFFTWDAISLGLPDIWDPWSILAAGATRTERITLGALVFALPRRRPWEVARQSLTIDHLSGGRLVLPVGLGVLDDLSFTAVPGQLTGLRERADLLDDALGYLERSWSGEHFAFDGTHLHTGGMQFDPSPVHGRIPVWPVAAWPSLRSMARAARWDGVVAQLRGERAMSPLEPADVTAMRNWVAERHAQARRPSTAETFDIVLQGALPDDRPAANDRLAALADAGATWWIESHWDPTTATPEALMQRIRQGPPRP